MKLVFLGATHEVTGSCTYIEACGKRFLVDFGMEQGINYFENEKVPCPPSSIDFVLLTHAHIDHSGLLPLLYAGGFAGQIHATVLVVHTREDVSVAIAVEANAKEVTPPSTEHVHLQVHDAALLEVEVEIG